MATYTSFFILSESLAERGIGTKKPELTKKHYTEAELLKELSEILLEIKTLEDYRTLIQIIHNIPGLSLQFLYVFFQALIPVEIRVWNTQGMNPPFQEALEANLHLLLDDYTTFVLNLEEQVTTWAKTNGYFDNDDTYNFILERNKIYADYVTLAGTIIDAFD